MKTSLEHAFDEAVGPYVEPCPACGGPSREPCNMIELGPLEEVPLCPACGRSVNHDGKTLLWFTGELVMPVIVIRRRQ